MKALGDICARHNVLVVSDEMHGDITFSGRRYTPFCSLGPEYARNCITCLSPAKCFNIASCCSAFTVIVDDERREAFQAGGRWLDEVTAYLEGNVELVRDYLQAVSDVELIEPQGTFLLWLDFRQLDLTSDGLTEFLRNKAKWAVTRGHAFGQEGAGFARLNIASPRAKLEAALTQLTNAMAALGT